MGPQIRLQLDWNNFYRSIRKPDWPDCPTFKDVKTLAQDIQQDILVKHLPARITWVDEFRTPSEFNVLASTPEQVEQLCAPIKIDMSLPSTEAVRKIKIAGIDVHFKSNTECGGIQRKDYFLQTLNHFFPGKKFTSCLEWCAGSGFIGFSILGNGICKKLTLAEAHKESIDLCEETIATLPDSTCAQTRHISRIEQLPPTDQFDLIVANPPWFPGHLLPSSMDQHRLVYDPGFELHNNFFANIKKHLLPGGIILLVEGINWSGPKDFKYMVEQNDLVISQVVEFKGTWCWIMTVEHA